MKKITEEQVGKIDWLLNQACFPDTKMEQVANIWNILSELKDSDEEELTSQLEAKDTLVAELKKEPEELEELKEMCNPVAELKKEVRERA